MSQSSRIDLVFIFKIILLILMILFGISLYKSIRKFFDSNSDRMELPVDTSKLTISVPVATNLAERLYHNMNFVSFRPVEIYSILKPLSGDDIRLVYNLYGERVKFFPASLGIWESLDLVGWIKNTVSSSSELYSDLNDKLIDVGIGW